MKARWIPVPLALGLGMVMALMCLLGSMMPNVTRAQGQLQNLSNQIPVNSITIDSFREDWESVIVYPRDPSGDNGSASNIDWITVTMAHDCDDLFIRLEVDDGPPYDPDNAFNYSLFLDVDNNRNTGYIGTSGQLSVGADVLLQGRKVDTDIVRASVFRFTGASSMAWAWSEINYYLVDDQVISGTKRDIEWKIFISDLDVFDTGISSFNWVAAQASGVYDFYPDGGDGGATGSFHTYTFNYTSTTLLLSNPERGFYEYSEAHSYNYAPLNLDTLRCYRENEGTTLIHRMFYLEDFVDSPISGAYTTAMQTDFDTVRQAGLKTIVRFAYTARTESPIGDATKEWIITHTKQLSPVLRANSDVIATMQAGFIGAWGEWWYSDHFTPDGDWDDRCEVLSATLRMLPITRMVQLRTPRYKMACFNTNSPVPPSMAHTGTDLARTGHHNDCFVSSASDYGTYTDTLTEYPYLTSDTKYVVMGGETCDPSYAIDPAPERLECLTATMELEQFHWSYLNIDWYEPTLRKWRDSGCFLEIGQRLGYRLELLDVDSSEQITAGQSLTLSLHINNEGYAASYTPRTVELVLRRTDGLTHAFELYNPDPSDTIDPLKDPRFWLAGGTYSPSYTSTIPLTLPAGSYELFLNLPDPELPHRPEYAMRLAGCEWEPSTGLNKLNCSVTVISHIYLPVVLKNRMISAETAYFKVGFPPDDVTFTIMLTDTAKIQEARDIVNGMRTDAVSVGGVIVKAPAFYNPPWSYHLDPASIEFFDTAIPECDAPPQVVEEHLEEVCGAFLPGCGWCPLSSVIMEEVPISEQVLPITLK